MSEITLFENPQFGKVRVVMRGNDPWFVAKDVAICLGYAKPANAVIEHCKRAEAYSQFGEPQNAGVLNLGTPVNSEIPANCSPLDPQTKLIPESDLYRLIMRSHLPAAEAFQDWVVEEVLPLIRKTGMYMPNFNDPLEAAKAWVKAEEEKRKAQLEAKAARVALSQKSAALAELLNDWGEGETFHSVIAESKRICKYFNVKYAIDPGDTVYKQLGQLMVKLCNGGYPSSGKGLIKDERFVGHKFPWEYKSHPSSTFGGWNVYHIDAWAYLYEVIERDGAASLPHVGKYAK